MVRSTFLEVRDAGLTNMRRSVQGNSLIQVTNITVERSRKKYVKKDAAIEEETEKRVNCNFQ